MACEQISLFNGDCQWTDLLRSISAWIPFSIEFDDFQLAPTLEEGDLSAAHLRLSTWQSAFCSTFANVMQKFSPSGCSDLLRDLHGGLTSHPMSDKQGDMWSTCHQSCPNLHSQQSKPHCTIASNVTHGACCMNLCMCPTKNTHPA